MKKLLVYVLIFFSTFCSIAQSFHSIHFRIQKCADGVYAAIAKNEGHAFGNAGIVDLGDVSLVFDTFIAPDAAMDLQKAALQLTGHKVMYVINSHFHVDHIGGNQVFKNSIIISTELTRGLISKYQLKEITDDTIACVELDKINKKNTSKMSAWELEDKAIWKGYYEVLIKYHHSIETVLPGLTFNDSLILHGKKRTVLLLSYGKGHTESDLFLYLPKEQIAFLGDLLFIKYQPYIGDGDINKWSIYLDSIARLKLKILVPGHGPVGTLSDFGPLKLYFETVKDAANAYHNNATLPENDVNMKPPPSFDKWLFPVFYSTNVIMEYNRMYRK